MNRLVFATNNTNKLREIREIVKGTSIEIISLEEIDCHDDIPEPFPSLEENALAKARYINSRYKLNCFADDTGLEIESLKGEPGVFSARYAGEPSDSKKNLAKVLNKMKDEKNRNAQFRTVIALIFDDEEQLFEGIVKGTISKKESGKDGFGYDPIFVPEGYQMTFAEMSATEKNKISHRALALQKLSSFLKNIK